MNRRDFLRCTAALTAVSATKPIFAQSLRKPDALYIPRWRGFNLQWHRPAGQTTDTAFDEGDFAAMKQWGFNFARIPLSYWLWSKPTDWMHIDEAPLAEIDRVVAMGQHYGVHINLNFHRIPGYCINGRELEPADLFTGHPDEGPRALKAACFHWATFAKRYKAIPSSQLSFDLINEPPKMRSYEGYFEDRYVEVATALIAAIREQDPNRLIFADGINIGQNPVLALAPLGIVQSTRGYQPKAITHYGATWVPLDEYETMKVPTWPLTDDKNRVWNRDRLHTEYVDRWKPLTQLASPIHVGEWGCYNKTPHAVALAWMQDCLSIWKEAGWGNALWNLRGDFGVMDSGRTDVAYVDHNGHKLDVAMLELLQHA
jgi:endoglucanase